MKDVSKKLAMSLLMILFGCTNLGAMENIEKEIKGSEEQKAPEKVFVQEKKESEAAASRSKLFPAGELSLKTPTTSMEKPPELKLPEGWPKPGSEKQKESEEETEAMGTLRIRGVSAESGLQVSKEPFASVPTASLKSLARPFMSEEQLKKSGTEATLQVKELGPTETPKKPQEDVLTLGRTSIPKLVAPSTTSDPSKGSSIPPALPPRERYTEMFTSEKEKKELLEKEMETRGEIAPKFVREATEALKVKRASEVTYKGFTSIDGAYKRPITLVKVDEENLKNLSTSEKNQLFGINIKSLNDGLEATQKALAEIQVRQKSLAKQAASPESKKDLETLEAKEHEIKAAQSKIIVLRETENSRYKADLDTRLDESKKQIQNLSVALKVAKISGKKENIEKAKSNLKDEQVNKKNLESEKKSLERSLKDDVKKAKAQAKELAKVVKNYDSDIKAAQKESKKLAADIQRLQTRKNNDQLGQNELNAFDGNMKRLNDSKLAVDAKIAKRDEQKKEFEEQSKGLDAIEQIRTQEALISKLNTRLSGSSTPEVQVKIADQIGKAETKLKNLQETKKSIIPPPEKKPSPES